MPRIAVGIPVFNEETNIAATVSSVLAQLEDTSDIEILISDNNSTDKTIREIESVLESLPTLSGVVRLSKNDTNLGPASNFWRVFDMTDSEYFLWVGAHDQLSKGYTAAGVRHLDAYPNTSMFCGLHKQINPDGQVIDKKIQYNFSQENPLERYLRSLVYLRNCYIFHSVFRRRALLTFDRTKQAPSLDHIIISRWLWFGCLFQSQECSYFRRYFPPANRKKKVAHGGYVSETNNMEFYDAYLSDLRILASELPKDLQEALADEAEGFLIRRFGVPYERQS